MRPRQPARKCLHFPGGVFQTALQAPLRGRDDLISKFQSFNIFRSGVEELSACTAYAYSVNGAGINLAAEPAVSALLAGVAVDLNSATQPEAFDLNAGGATQCSPVLLTIDLNA